MNDLARVGFPPETPARFTIDEFMRLLDAPAILGADQFELHDGIIVRAGPQTAADMAYKRRLFLTLDEIFLNGPDLIVQPKLTLQLGPATLRNADLGVLAPFPPVPVFPDPATVLMIVEVCVSTLNYDLNVKRLDYARAGIPHYWVVDIEGRRTHAMTTPLDGDYAERKPYAFGEPLPVPGTDRTIVID